jgi:hypothetical protein
MSVARHRFGPQFVVHVAVDSATAIQAGDALFLDGDDAKPAASFPWTSDLATTQAGFVNQFLGLALADHPANSDAVTNFPVDISPLAVYELSCAAQTHEVGDTLGMKKATGNSLESALVEKATAAGSCFRCVRRSPVARDKVYVRMQSAYWGVNDATRQ